MQVLKENDPAAIALACKLLKEGKAISFATDTVYGIAVDAANEAAVAKLYQIKKRDRKKPIVIFVKDLQAAAKIFSFERIAKEIAEKFLPGKLTLILKLKSQNSAQLASNLSASDDGFLGFRIVDHTFTKNLLANFAGNLAVTSANLSGQKAATSAKEVEKYFSDSNPALALLVDGGNTDQILPSTVAKISDGKITILREGLVKI